MSSNGKGLSSPKGKKAVGYAYGFGASIVIIGALMKIMHWPGWDIFLPLGMGVEAFLFALGAFEAPHHEGSKWDWSSLYPELTREKSPAELLEDKKIAKKTGKQPEKSTPKTSATKAATVARPNLTEQSTLTTSAKGLSDADMDKWNKSISKISDTADQLSKLSEAGNVTESYVGKLKNAGDAVEQLSNAQEASAVILTASTGHLAENYKVSSEKFDLTMSTAAEKFDTTMEAAAEVVKKDLEGASQKASEVLKGSTEKIATSYAVTAEKFESTFISAYTDSASSMSKASASLTSSYTQVTEALNQKLKVIEGATTETGKTLQSVGKNLTAINSVYELQLTSINEELKVKEALTATQGNINDQLSLIQKAVSESLAANTEYKKGSEKLKNNIADLNKVYGNMLSSLNA